MTCKICNGKTDKLFTATLLRKYNVHYKRCLKCGFVSTEDPYWLSEAYDKPINKSDTGLLARNERIRDALVCLFYLKYPKHGQFLDYAGGYGLLTRMMRDQGFNYFWLDPLCENLFSQGFEMKEEHLPYNAISCCECFEHFSNPMDELKKIFRYGSTVFFTTTLIPEPPPRPEDWDYYGFNHGQHVSFYTLESLKHLASRHNMKLSSNGRNFHCIGTNVPSQLLMKTMYSPFTRFARILLSYIQKSHTLDDWKVLNTQD